MDIWRATDQQIKSIAEQRTGKKAVSIYKPSGLYAWVKMQDGHTVTVYESELEWTITQKREKTKPFGITGAWKPIQLNTQELRAIF